MKLLLLFGLVATAATYVWAIMKGRRTRIFHEPVVFHQLAAWTALITLLANVVLIEICTRIKGGARYDLLFCVHICFAVPTALAMLLLVVRLNGRRWPIHHAKLAYGSALLFSGMFVTGLWMILTRF